MIRETTTLRCEDDRVKQFVKLQTFTGKALLFDTAIELDMLDFTHYEKRTSSFSRIDYFTFLQTRLFTAK